MVFHQILRHQSIPVVGSIGCAALLIWLTILTQADARTEMDCINPSPICPAGSKPVLIGMTHSIPPSCIYECQEFASFCYKFKINRSIDGPIPAIGGTKRVACDNPECSVGPCIINTLAPSPSLIPTPTLTVLPDSLFTRANSWFRQWRERWKQRLFIRKTSLEI